MRSTWRVNEEANLGQDHKRGEDQAKAQADDDTNQNPDGTHHDGGDIESFRAKVA